MATPAPSASPSTNSTSPPAPPTSASSPSTTPTTPAPTTTPSPPPPSTTTPAPAASASPPPTTSTPDTSPPPSSTAGSPPPPSSGTTTSPPPPSGSSSSSSPPPPSSSSSKSPPPPSSSTSSHSPPPPPSSSSSSSSSGVSTGMVVGIAIGGVVILAILSLFFLCCTKKRKKRRDDEYGAEGHYMPPLPHPGPKDGYGGGQAAAQHWQQQSNPQQPDNYAIPKPPNHQMGRPPMPLQQPPAPPPPLPPFMSSSGGSAGSNYSGSEAPLPPPSPGLSLGFSKSTFTYEELAMATDGFSQANLLGQGGFGYVHKGILPTGKEVAVKSLKAGSGQGEREFQAEVEIITRVHHKHLVSLVGYCITGSQRMLVYEFVPNNTMEFHLHGTGRPTMEWSTRLRIALGSAKGLAYLHEDCHPKIIHRDIKSSNILLDFKFEAKVADFGLARIASDLNTHVSTRVMGTFGYLAPEYASSGKLTDKSDVFSYGVMLLELITGRRPVDPRHTYMEDSLVDWARPQLSRALEEDKFDSLVDPKLENNYSHSEMARMVACAAACVRHSARRRPRMSQIVRALEGDVSLSDLNEGVRPGHSTVYGSYGSSDYDSGMYREDMKKFRQTAFASQEHASSEYGGTTSEYGLYPSGSSSEAQTTREMTREMEMGKVKRESRGFSSTTLENETGKTKDSQGFSGSYT